MTGPGGVSGVEGGLQVRDVESLNFEGQIVFLGVPYSGAVGARFEMDVAALAAEPLGLVMKRTYDAARLTRHPHYEPLPRFEAGQFVPAGFERNPKPYEALSRILIGDPSQTFFTRASHDLVRFDGATPAAGADGRPTTVIRYRVVAPDAKLFFADAIGEGDRLHIRHPLPPGSEQVACDLAGVEVDGKQVTARLLGQALESWEETLYLHALVGADAGALSRLDLTVSLSIRQKE
ncbi:MAG: hypothetical protein HY716_14015 [Planctomycetes bacterium]|nr:hypothetical protein [Planctomycetota bacterium]